MKRITKIEFLNYRGFYNKVSIDFFKPEENDEENRKNQKSYSKNVIIYGENGSGKSSLYEGLKQFFLSSVSTEPVDLSRHIKVDEFKPDGVNINDVYIKATFTDYVLAPGNTNQFIKQEEIKTFGILQRDTTISGISGNYIAQANNLKAFLSYKELLRTHFMEGREFKRKFARLIVEYILSSHVNTITNNNFKKDWAELNKSIARTRKRTLLSSWDLGFKHELRKLNLIINYILNYFDPNLTIELIHENTILDANFRPICSVDTKVVYYQVEVSDHLSILNEARLSALAIAIYFSALATNPQNNAPYKILFLDDIFVGLDMSNRIPLLKILSEFKNPKITIDPINLEWIYEIDIDTGSRKIDSEPFFNTYQIFLTTYDRHWFEIANYYLSSNKWVALEMYKVHDEIINFEIPIVVTPSLNYYEKAIKYFEKGERDYPAAGNYLRKEYERIFKEDLLYGKYLLKPEGDKGALIEREQLGDLWDIFKKMILDLGLSVEQYDAFDIISKTVLNPLSHDNLAKPIYKRELQDAFDFLDMLKTLKRKTIIQKDDEIFIQTNNRIIRNTFLKANLDVVAYKQAANSGAFLYGFSQKFQPIRFEELGTITSILELPEMNLQKAYDKVYHHVFNIYNASTSVNVFEHFHTVKDNKSIQSLLDSI